MESRTWPYLTSYKEDSASPLMTVPELAEYLDVGRNTVYSLLRDGSIKGFRIGSSWKVSREAVDLFIRIRTTGLAGGLLTPYKGLLPALESKDSSKGSPAATSFTCPTLKGSSYLLCFTSSPVNGSIYSLSVIWSYSKSSFIWLWIYSCIFFAFFPTVST